VADLISEYRVLRSAAGWYIGEVYWDEDLEYWLPWDRTTGYFRDEEMAVSALIPFIYDQAFDKEEEAGIHHYIDAMLNGWDPIAHMAAMCSWYEPRVTLYIWPNGNYRHEDEGYPEIFTGCGYSDDFREITVPSTVAADLDEGHISALKLYERGTA